VNRPRRLDRRTSPRHLESDPVRAQRFSVGLRREGYDGVIKEIGQDGHAVVVVYRPEQIRVIGTETVEGWK